MLAVTVLPGVTATDLPIKVNCKLGFLWELCNWAKSQLLREHHSAYLGNTIKTITQAPLGNDHVWINNIAIKVIRLYLERDLWP